MLKMYDHRRFGVKSDTFFLTLTLLAMHLLLPHFTISYLYNKKSLLSV